MPHDPLGHLALVLREESGKGHGDGGPGAIFLVPTVRRPPLVRNPHIASGIEMEAAMAGGCVEDDALRIGTRGLGHAPWRQDSHHILVYSPMSGRPGLAVDRGNLAPDRGQAGFGKLQPPTAWQGQAAVDEIAAHVEIHIANARAIEQQIIAVRGFQNHAAVIGFLQRECMSHWISP